MSLSLCCLLSNTFAWWISWKVSNLWSRNLQEILAKVFSFLRCLLIFQILLPLGLVDVWGVGSYGCLMRKWLFVANVLCLEMGRCMLQREGSLKWEKFLRVLHEHAWNISETLHINPLNFCLVSLWPKTKKYQIDLALLSFNLPFYIFNELWAYFLGCDLGLEDWHLTLFNWILMGSLSILIWV